MNHRIVRSLATIGPASRIGLADLFAIYTWRTWVFGWFGRLCTQVIFFSLFGLLLGSKSEAQYRVVGNAVVLVCVEAMATVNGVVRERNEGTLGLQMLTPTPYVLTFIWRMLYVIPLGAISAIGAFLIAAPIFGIHARVAAVASMVPLLVVAAASCYSYGLALGAFSAAKPTIQWFVINIGYLSVMTFAGVNVPTSFWPSGIRWLADFLPVTHGLSAIREALAPHSSTRYVLRQTSLEIAVAAAWLSLAVAVFMLAGRSDRRRGTVDLMTS